PEVSSVTVRAKVCPSKVPVHRATSNRAGMWIGPPGLRGGGARAFPSTGIPAIEPVYGCGALLVVGDPIECQVKVAVPEPVGNEGDPHPARVTALNATRPPSHDAVTIRRGARARHEPRRVTAMVNSCLTESARRTSPGASCARLPRSAPARGAA